MASKDGMAGKGSGAAAPASASLSSGARFSEMWEAGGVMPPQQNRCSGLPQAAARSGAARPPASWRGVGDAGRLEDHQLAQRQRLADFHRVRLDGVRQGALGESDADGGVPVEQQDDGMKPGSLQRGRSSGSDCRR